MGRIGCRSSVLPRAVGRGLSDSYPDNHGGAGKVAEKCGYWELGLFVEFDDIS